MRRIIFILDGPTVGMTSYEAHSFPDDATDKEIDDACHIASVEHLQSYGYDFDPDWSGDEEDEFGFSPEHIITEMEYGSWEPYDPEQHEGHRAGGGLFSDDFEEQE
jgi:hypothetical protein